MKNKEVWIGTTMEKQWKVYILQCSDNTLYTGITDDIDKRLKIHNLGKGAKYTRSRRPVQLLYEECCSSKSSALQREIQIKRLPRSDKLKICELKENGE